MEIKDSIMTVKTREARDTTKFFNRRFRDAGSPIRASQYEMLRMVSIFNSKYGLTAAGEKMCTDRSTLDRNLSLLERDGYLQSCKVGGVHRATRQRIFSLTEKGKQTLSKYANTYLQADRDYQKGNFGNNKEILDD